MLNNLPVKMVQFVFTRSICFNRRSLNAQNMITMLDHSSFSIRFMRQSVRANILFSDAFIYELLYTRNVSQYIPNCCILVLLFFPSVNSENYHTCNVSSKWLNMSKCACLVWFKISFYFSFKWIRHSMVCTVDYK